MNWKVHRSTFSDLLPHDVYGHWGATGTLFWVDPTSGLGVVMTSTAPMKDEVSPLTRLSNMIAAAVSGCAAPDRISR
jgi:CubicO group peptidase (beta-lactamase class C family)